MGGSAKRVWRNRSGVARTAWGAPSTPAFLMMKSRISGTSSTTACRMVTFGMDVTPPSRAGLRSGPDDQELLERDYHPIVDLTAVGPFLLQTYNRISPPSV